MNLSINGLRVIPLAIHDATLATAIREIAMVNVNLQEGEKFQCVFAGLVLYITITLSFHLSTQRSPMNDP